MILKVIGNEIYKSLLQLWSYKYNTIAEVAQRVIGFLVIGFVLGQGQLNSTQLAFLLPGWVLSFYGRIILRQAHEAISEEARTGTLEQIYMSVVSSAWLLTGRVFAILCMATIQICVLVGVLLVLTPIAVPLRWEVLPVLLISLAGLFGFSFLLDGAALVLKSISSLVDLTQDLLLFVNGTLVDVSLLPGWLRTLGLALPTTYGIVLMRRILFENRSLTSLLQDGSLALLTAHSAAYVIVGWLGYKWCENIARRQGTLGRY